MKRLTWLPTLLLAVLVASAGPLWAQSQYIGYVYPAGGQQGTTFPMRLGGQGLVDVCGLVVTGDGVSVRLVDYYRYYDNQELGLLRQQLTELKKKEANLSGPIVQRMAGYELPAPIGPPELVLASLTGLTNDPSTPLEELAKQKLIARIETIFAEDERDPAVLSHRELVFAEVTIAPDAKPGKREIRVVTRRGVSNPLTFYVGQVPEVARKPVKTAKKPVLGKEELAERKRPPEEEELRVIIPCTMNGQIYAGEINRYRFHASKGQRLVISVKARDLIPYVADAVPGWFQAVLRLCDANGKELAYQDDFRFDPDPVIYFEVPADGEYVLSITDALYRGRESFVYRITIGELPFITSIFPLGGRVGEPVKIELEGWNLQNASLTPPSADAKPGVHILAASNGQFVSNQVRFALDTLPESLEQEPNDNPSQAQKVTLPIIVNGRMDREGDWDVFEVEGHAGETIVMEVNARRLGSPMDSFVKVTTADGKVIGLNDDHFDATTGWNTDHADSYLMVKLPADGKYFVHLGDTRRHAGKAYAYRLRISPPRPDFALCVAPSRIIVRKNNSAAVTVYAIRKDGFNGPIQVSLKDLPQGVESAGVTVAGNQQAVGLAVKAGAVEMQMPLAVTVVGTAKIGDQEVTHEIIPTEGREQAFDWRHLLPVDNLPLLAFNPAYQPPAERVRPPIPDELRPKDVTPSLRAVQVQWRLRQIERLYQEWLLTDEFANREIANIEAMIVK